MSNKILKDNQEEIIINGITFIKTTPKENHELIKVGTNEHYAEAIDLPTSNFEYIEVELPQEVLNEQQTNNIGE